MEMPNITDKVVVITGASSGVGEATARLLAGNGAKVVLGARRKDRIDALVRDITGKGGNALGFKTDVTRRGDVEALVKGAVDKHGRIDAIVNNSGIMPIAPMAALRAVGFDKTSPDFPAGEVQRDRHGFCRGLQSLGPGRHRIQRDEVRRAGAD